MTKKFPKDFVFPHGVYGNAPIQDSEVRFTRYKKAFPEAVPQDEVCVSICRDCEAIWSKVLDLEKQIADLQEAFFKIGQK